MTLYRKAASWNPDDPRAHPDGAVLRWVHPVDRCEHGFIDPHDTEYDPFKDRALDGHRCEGAGLDSEKPSYYCVLCGKFNDQREHDCSHAAEEHNEA